MGMITFVLSLVAMLLTMIAFIPFLGWLNWVIIPLSILALVANVVFHNVDMGMRNLAKSGMIISLIAIAIGIIRLSLGGGIL